MEGLRVRHQSRTVAGRLPMGGREVTARLPAVFRQAMEASEEAQGIVTTMSLAVAVVTAVAVVVRPVMVTAAAVVAALPSTAGITKLRQPETMGTPVMVDSVLRSYLEGVALEIDRLANKGNRNAIFSTDPRLPAGRSGHGPGCAHYSDLPGVTG